MSDLRSALRARLVLERVFGVDLLPVRRQTLVRRPSPSASPRPAVIRPASPDSEPALPISDLRPSSRKPEASPARISRDPAKAEALAKLEAKAKVCRLCGLCETRTQAVFGTGNPDADLCIVGEAPGADEDRLGEPFVGRAGQLLNQLLAHAGLRRDEVYICNVLKCRPSMLKGGSVWNRPPEPAEVLACRSYLLEQLVLVAPRAICTMGAFAVRAVLGHEGTMGSVRGRLQTWNGVPLMPTYHPAYLLRSPGEIPKVKEDLKQIVAQLAEMKKG